VADRVRCKALCSSMAWVSAFCCRLDEHSFRRPARRRARPSLHVPVISPVLSRRVQGRSRRSPRTCYDRAAAQAALSRGPAISPNMDEPPVALVAATLPSIAARHHHRLGSVRNHADNTTDKAQRRSRSVAATPSWSPLPARGEPVCRGGWIGGVARPGRSVTVRVRALARARLGRDEMHHHSSRRQPHLPVLVGHDFYRVAATSESSELARSGTGIDVGRALLIERWWAVGHPTVGASPGDLL
jgi:hypothetical protein